MPHANLSDTLFASIDEFGLRLWRTIPHPQTNVDIIIRVSPAEYSNLITFVRNAGASLYVPKPEKVTTDDHT